MPLKKPHHTSDSAFVIPQADGSFEIKPKGLNIVWGNDSRYWKIPADDGPAKLIQVSWLEVSGLVTVEKNKKYNVKFHVRVNQNGFGWNGTKVLVMAKVGKKGSYTYKEATLNPDGKSLTIPSDDPLEIEAASDNQLYFGLYEVWSGKWKGGLEIIKAEIVPVN